MQIFNPKILVSVFALAVSSSLSVVDVKASAVRGFSFDSAIVDAVENNQKDTVQLLLGEGISPDEQGKFETTPMHRASYKGYDDIIKVLVNNGADINARDFGGATPMHMAARQGNIDSVRKLLKSGADLNVKDNEGFTPLQRAISGENTAVALFLIEAGANPSLSDNNGNTPLIEAIRKQNDIVAEELISSGASPNQANKSGITGLDFASKVNNSKILDVVNKSPLEIKRERALQGSSIVVVSENQLNSASTPGYLKSKNVVKNPVNRVLSSGSQVSTRKITPYSIKPNDNFDELLVPSSEQEVVFVNESNNYRKAVYDPTLPWLQKPKTNAYGFSQCSNILISWSK